ncbi:MAG: hypothetical protein Q4E69_02480 [Bacilli bacterium]|nr:hypothetical protein [Bacilli bacterium]
MAFFDQNISPEEQKSLEEENRELNTEIQEVNEELDVNRKNREEYEDLMEKSKTNLDTYYDKNNVVVKLILFLLFVFIACGLVYYLLLYLRAK